MTAAGARNARPPVPDWAPPWIASFERSLESDGRSHHTVYRYTDACRWFAGWLAPTRPKLDDWADVTRDDIRGFFAYLHQQGYSRKYTHNIGGALQSFWKWYAVEEGVPNLFDVVRPPAAPKLGETPPPIIAVEQLATLIKDAESERTFEHRRDAAILRMFAATGCRLGELAGLTLAEVRDHLNERQVTVTGKGGKVRILRYDHKCALAIDRYLRMRAKHRCAYLPALWLGTRRDTAMTHSGIRQMVERRGERLGLDIHPHLFRHTFAHNWLDAGGAEGDLLELAGWDSPQMLKHYGRSARSARARRAYDRVDVMGGV